MSAMESPITWLPMRAMNSNGPNISLQRTSACGLAAELGSFATPGRWFRFSVRGAVLALALAFVSPSAFGAARAPARVECDADDGLTSRFCDTLRTAVERSATFVLDKRASESLVLLVPANLPWCGTDSGSNFMALVVVVDHAGRYFGTFSTLCREADMKSCAEAALSFSSSVRDRAEARQR